MLAAYANNWLGVVIRFDTILNSGFLLKRFQLCFLVSVATFCTAFVIREIIINLLNIR